VAARAEAYLRAKFHLDPSNRLTTDRQTGQDRTDNGSDSIGQTVLQTVAQKSHLTRRIALSCGITISPVGSLGLVAKHACDRRTDGQNYDSQDALA